MTQYILRRFVNSLVLTVIATVFSYIAASLFFYPRRRYLGINPPIPEESVDGILSAYGVNDKDPVLLRTWWWIERIIFEPLSQKLGQDLQGNWVINEIVGRAGTSLRLLLLGALLAALLGVTLGVWGAVRQYKASDQIVSYASFILISTPTFVGGVILMILATNFNQLLGFQMIRFTGSYTPGITGFFPQLWDGVVHLLLPTIALMLFGAAGYSRYQRSLMLDVLGSDYLRTARAKGLTRGKAMNRHGLRMALIPMGQYFAFAVGGAFSGSLFVELMFNWQGIGRFVISAIGMADVNGTAGVVFYTAVLTLLSATFADILQGALDPRIR